MKIGESKNLIIKLKLPKLLVRSLDRIARRRGLEGVGSSHRFSRTGLRIMSRISLRS
ncbi:MAG: hypothetical protein J7L79_04800 [Thaumarchaeota archaeon]|nr:hypothetical protein [Nitrososphaerota archaeon]